MQILTYTNTAQDAPDQYRAVALIYHANLGQMHPVMIHGRDEAEARQKAQAFWDREVERINKRDARPKESREAEPSERVAGEKPKSVLELQAERRARFVEEAQALGFTVPLGIDLRSKEGRALKEAVAAKKAELGQEPELQQAAG
jgi:hypothetical protein